MELHEALSFVRDIPDFPHAGILFKDITPLLGNADALSSVVHNLIGESESFSYVAGVEARGFILGAAMAIASSTGFIPVRKSGKLPHQTISKSYGLEYGSDSIEVHIDALAAGEQVLVVDDVLATGGTLIATLELMEELGAEVVEVVVLYEISALGGRERIRSRFPNVAIRALIAA